MAVVDNSYTIVWLFFPLSVPGNAQTASGRLECNPNPRSREQKIFTTRKFFLFPSFLIWITSYAPIASSWQHLINNIRLSSLCVVERSDLFLFTDFQSSFNGAGFCRTDRYSQFSSSESFREIAGWKLTGNHGDAIFYFLLSRIIIQVLGITKAARLSQWYSFVKSSSFNYPLLSSPKVTTRWWTIEQRLGPTMCHIKCVSGALDTMRPWAAPIIH